MDLRNVRDINGVFHENYQLTPRFFSGLALVDKTLVFFAAYIPGDLVHAVFCVNADPWYIGIVTPRELTPHQVYTRCGKALMLDIMLVDLLSAVFDNPHS